MTYKEKILQAFPKAKFEIIDIADSSIPSICPADLGIAKECGVGIGCSTCEECWELEADDDD